ncbi:MAG: GTPase HflX [Clostridiales bacterium]|nr:GTPase HflX [Clostridiales bacterium]
MPEVTGNLTGIRDSVKAQLNALYDVETDASAFLSQELAARLASLTALLRREIAVYIARNGKILGVSVGHSDNVALEDFGLRRSSRRLSRVRCVHTHPNGDATLSDVDLSAVVSLRLDAMCALGVDEAGEITGATVSFLAPDEEGSLQAGHIEALHAGSLDSPGLMERVAGNDRLLIAGEQETQEERERAFLVSVDSERSLRELEALADSAGALVVGSALQPKARPDPATYVGSGKAEEIALDAQAAGANLLIVDDELTAVSARRLEDIVSIPVVDRTTLILDIFAQRATSSEGKLQVSLAQLNYRASRLIGARASLSRLAGGIGTRGPGESKLEMDRRYIRRRIQILKDALRELERQRGVRRKNRQGGDLPAVALVGYTNTGKSTLLNLLSGADVLVKDQLFATLDTVSRKITLKEGDEFLLTDSVGFISKLPTDLVEAFRSTLDEALSADVLVIVSDASNPQAAEQRRVVDEVLADLGAAEQPRIEVYNKADAAPAGFSALPPGALLVSARTGEGVGALLDAIARELRKRERSYTLFVPFGDYGLLGEIRRQGRIVEEAHQDEGTRVVIRLTAAAAGRLKAQHPGLFGETRG